MDMVVEFKMPNSVTLRVVQYCCSTKIEGEVEIWQSEERKVTKHMKHVRSFAGIRHMICE